MIVVAMSTVFLSLVGRVSGGSQESRHAGMPDSWIILYNANDPDSFSWQFTYRLMRGIPHANMIGLSASLDEHLDTKAEAQEQIIDPVREFLAANPQIEQRVMGIVLGYGLPGTYGTAPGGGPGGFSIADALEDMSDDHLPPADQRGFNSTNNPQFLQPASTLPPGGRLTKNSLLPGRYMTARIDAPSRELALQLSTRALAIESGAVSMQGLNVYVDYVDEQALPQGEWLWLRWAVEEPDLLGTPWYEFDSDTQTVSNCAFRFGTHALTNWNDDRLYGGQNNARILAFNYNSYGATTVRSTTNQGGRYVPNAINAGYAAAIGATGEPFCCLGPVPETIIAGLREGWTIGESFHVASVYDDWMWTLFADPFLTLPEWFPEPIPGDANNDGVVNGWDIQKFAAAMTGDEIPAHLIDAFDISRDGVVDEDDAFLLTGPLLYDTDDPDVLRGSGDMDDNGRVDGRDLEKFTRILLDGEENYSLRDRFTADTNRDGRVNVGDIGTFVLRLIDPDACDGCRSGKGGDKSLAGNDSPSLEVLRNRHNRPFRD